MRKKEGYSIGFSRRKFAHGNPYDEAFFTFHNDASVLKELNKIMPTKIKEYFNENMNTLSEKVSNLEGSEREDWTKIIEMIENVTNKKTRKSSLNINRNAGILFENIIRNFMFENRFVIFVRQMSLIYLIISFEEFLSQILEVTFIKKPQILKTKDKTITYEELLSSNKINSIKEKIIEKEIKNILNLDIEEIRIYLTKNLKIQLEKNKMWNSLTECFYRRHLIVHKSGHIDEKYRLKTGYSGTEKHLTVDEKYLNDSINVFERYAITLRDLFKQKFR